MRPVVWSHSSINAYLDCHLQWYFAYVLLEEGELSEAMDVGIRVHEVAEWILKNNAPVPDFENMGDIADLTDVFAREVFPTYGEPVLVEAEFQYELDGIPVSGVIDALDKHHHPHPPEVDWDSEGRDAMVPVDLAWDEYILRDLKTAKQRPRKGRYRLQATIYWLGVQELGYEPSIYQLDYIVRTKTPYYWPEVLEPITEDDVDVLSATLQAVDNGVSREDYDPTGLGTMACSTCPYKAICGPYERYLELTNPIRKEARSAHRN